MADYISREAAIVELNAEGYTKNMRVHKRILSIPTADMRPVVHGKWKHINNRCDGYAWQICSECGEKGKSTWNFCRNCGACMREVKNGEK